MWWNDSFMPEYIFSNHEAYIGDTAPKVAVKFASLVGYICIGGVFLALLNYYYGMDYIPRFTYTKQQFSDYFDNGKRMMTEKVGLQKDFMGSGIHKAIPVSNNPRLDRKKLYPVQRLRQRLHRVRRVWIYGHCEDSAGYHVRNH